MDLLIDVELVVRGRSIILQTTFSNWRLPGWARGKGATSPVWEAWVGPFLFQWW